MAKRTKSIAKTLPKAKSTGGVTNKLPSAGVASHAPRRLRFGGYKSFRLQKHIKPKLPRLSNPFRLLKATFDVLFKHWRVFGGLMLIYALLTLVFVRGFGSSLDFGGMKATLHDIFGGGDIGASVAVSASVFGLLLDTAGSVGTPSGAAYQTMLFVITALATIWSLRKVLNGEKTRVRDAFYRGLYPLAVFVLVLGVVGLQLVPLVVGSWLYNTLTGTGIVVSFAEQALAVLLFALLIVLSLYMVASSVFALCISTLPDMTPLRALRSAQKLVLYRRLAVLIRLAALAVALPVIAGILMLPLIVFLVPFAEWVFFILTMAGTIFAFTYIYLLYRELLNE